MLLFKEIPENTVGRDFAVGDIHGMLHLFEDKLREIGFDKTKDRMFSVGDLVDRGPDSLGALKLIREPWFFAVRGNHEDMMIDAMTSQEFSVQKGGGRVWAVNGGDWVTDENAEEVRRLCYEFIDNVPLVNKVIVKGKPIFISHAAPLVAWNDETIADSAHSLIWDRSVIHTYLLATQTGSWTNLFKNAPISVHGHTPTKMPIVADKRVNWIDTGAFGTNILTVVDLAEVVKNAE